MSPNPLGYRLPVLGGLRLSPVEVGVAGVLLILSAYFLIGGLVASWPPDGGLMNEAGLAVGRDFTMFWSASLLVLEGNAAGAYDLNLIREVQGSLTGVPDPAYPAWLYPPTALLLVAPVSLLPYKVALVVWSALGLAGLGAVLLKVLRDPAAVVVLLLFPAVSLCLINGQSGLLLAALLGGGLVLLDRRPWLAGILLGLATVKPQLLLLVVPCLLLARSWRALAGLGAAFIGLAILSLVAFGSGPWVAFLDSVVGGVDILELVRPLERMPSVFVAGSLVGLSPAAAAALQAAAAIFMLVVVGRLWLLRLPIAIRGSALLFAAPLVTPYSFDYDLSVLTVALAWLAVAVVRRGWLRGEKTLVALLWISPLAGWLIALRTGLLLTPLVLLACVWAVVRAARVEPEPAVR